MTIKERKLILYFLEALLVNIESIDDQKVSREFLHLFSRKELIDIVLWLFSNYDKSMLTEKTEVELFELIGDDANVLAYVIEQWKHSINATPTMSQEEIYKFFKQIPIPIIHYLRDKPVEQWDEYDTSNYYSLLFKHGKTKRVFAIFTSDVKDEDKYAVTTQPSLFFDTKEEAEEELQRIYEQGLHKWDSLKIMSLWKIT